MSETRELTDTDTRKTVNALGMARVIWTKELQAGNCSQEEYTTTVAEIDRLMDVFSKPLKENNG